jgi:hypothetical protein
MLEACTGFFAEVPPLFGPAAGSLVALLLAASLLPRALPPRALEAWVGRGPVPGKL